MGWLKSGIRRTRSFFRLTSDDRFMLLAVTCRLACYRVGLAVLPFTWFKHLFVHSCLEVSESGQPGDEALVERMCWAVETAGRVLLGGGSCLPRALTASSLLARHGIATQLRLGVSRGAEGGFEAHAWVERDGEILVGDLEDLDRFAPFGEDSSNSATPETVR